MTEPFTITGATVNIAASGSTGSVALTTPSGQGGMDVVVTNAGAATVFIAFGASTVTATTAAGMPILAGAAHTLSVGPSVTHAAAITASGTATVYFTPGRGA